MGLFYQKKGQKHLATIYGYGQRWTFSPPDFVPKQYSYISGVIIGLVEFLQIIFVAFTMLCFV